MPQVKTQTEIEKDKQQKIMETVAWRAGYYRSNIDMLLTCWDYL